MTRVARQLSVKKNYFYNAILMGTNLLFPLVTFPYVARVLGPEGIGNAQFAFTYAQYFSLLAAVGIPYYGIKEIAMSRGDRSKLNKTFSELFFISMITTCIAVTIYLISINVIGEFQSNQSLYIISGSILVFSFLNLDWFFNGLENFKFVSLRSVLIKVLALIGLYSLVKEPEDIKLYVAILAFSFVGNFFLNVFFLKKYVKLTFRGLNLKRHISPLLFILSASFATTIYSTLDSVTLGFITNKIQVGLYAASIKLAKVGVPLITSLSAVLVPKIANAIERKSIEEELTILKKSFAFIAFLAVPIAFGLYIYADNFILVFSGKEFVEASVSLRYMACLPVFIGLGYLFGFQILIPRGHNKYLLYATLSGLLVFIALNLTITPYLGASGTAIAILCTEFIVTLLYMILSPKQLRADLPWIEFIKASLSCSSFFILKLILSSLEFDSTVELIMGIIFSAAVYFMIQGFLFSNQFVTSAVMTLKGKLNRVK